MKPRILAAPFLLSLLVLGLSRPALAGPTSWRVRYEAARHKVARGECESAIVDLDELAATAPADEERHLAEEMASVCRETLKPSVSVPDPARLRTTDEMTLLYANAFVYGLGTSAWFVLETKPDNVLAAMLPFAGFTVGSVGAVTLIDRLAPFPRGVPTSLATGLYLGLGEGVWITAVQHARSTRIREATGHDPRWTSETTATVLWSMSTLGVVAGGLLGYAREPTPGRVAFTASCTLWGGVLGGALAGAIHPYGPRRNEDTFFAAGMGYNLGLMTGVVLGPYVAPSALRMRLVDLGGVAGGLALGGGYALAAGKDSDARAGLGFAAGGALLGLGLTWAATSSMAGVPAKAQPGNGSAAGAVSAQPSVVPLPGGVQAGVAGVF